MNATPPVSQIPPSPSPVQSAAPAAADQTDRSNGQDFAGAMNAAGGRPVRKPGAKQHDSASGGSALPVVGNQPPPNAAAAASTASAAANGQTGTAAVSGNSGTGVATAAPAAPAAGSTATPSDSANAPPSASEQVATPPITSAAAEELAAAATPSAVDLRDIPPTPGGAMAGAAPTMPHATSIQAPPTAVPLQAAQPAAAQGVATPSPSAAAVAAPKITDAAASKAEIAAATSAPTPTNAGAAQNAQGQAGAATAADANAAAQLAMAAAVAQGTSAPSPDSSASSDDLATPDTGVTLQGAAAANDAAAAMPTALPHAATAPTSASVTAASAAAVVQAVSATADSGPTDKHSRDNSPDGSVGAAQLLSSNAASDTAPGATPTFKVSAGVDTAEFGQGVADRVSLMMDGNLTSAKLQVNPPALGPIEVRIALQGGHAQVWMSSHSAVTRDALESTSPKLREMLGSQGFTQVSVDISQRSFQERTPQPKGYESVSALGSGSAVPAHASVATVRSASGLLDAYA
jgi:flagellar hook-length control protein FliK